MFMRLLIIICRELSTSEIKILLHFYFVTSLRWHDDCMKRTSMGAMDIIWKAMRFFFHKFPDVCHLLLMWFPVSFTCLCPSYRQRSTTWNTNQQGFTVDWTLLQMAYRNSCTCSWSCWNPGSQCWAQQYMKTYLWENSLLWGNISKQTKLI